MSGEVKPTKRQAELLRWLVAAEKRRGEVLPGRRCEFSGGSLVTYYQERSRSGYASTGRQHAYRRNGGLQLRRLADNGWLRRVRWSYGVPQYVLTDAGREAVA